MVSGTDLLLPNLQRTRSGDMKQGWPCPCGLQGVSHLDGVPWACQGKPVLALSAAHPTVGTGIWNKAHVLLHGTCVRMLGGAAVEMHTQGGIRGGPLQPAL